MVPSYSPYPHVLCQDQTLFLRLWHHLDLWSLLLLYVSDLLSVQTQDLRTLIKLLPTLRTRVLDSIIVVAEPPLPSPSFPSCSLDLLQLRRVVSNGRDRGGAHSLIYFACSLS